jgi:hypothetical protein
LSRAARALAVAGAVICWAAAPIAAQAATTRYVATAANGGNNNGGANTCTSQSAPCLTIGQAVKKAASGDTIQIGPGAFNTAVDATAKALTFIGAGPGSPTAFDPSANTFVDAGGTAKPGLTTGNHDTTVQGLRIRGGVGSSNTIEAAIEAEDTHAVTALTLTNDVVLQASPPNAGPLIAEAISAASVTAGTGLNVSVTASTIVPYQIGIFLKQPTGSLSVTDSSVLAPAPVSNATIIPIGVDANVPISLTDDTVTGTVGVEDLAAGATITRTVIHASKAGIRVYDRNDSAALTLRDSVIAPDAATLAAGVQIVPLGPGLEVPALDLTFDTILARAKPPAYALDATQASPGTRIRTRNTILEAIDASGGTGADEIAAANGLSWDLGTTDYQHTLGPGIPAAGSGTNLNLDPALADPAGGSLTLAATSPLFDRGDPSVVTAGETDVTGAPRAVPHTCGGAALPDLGAYEAPAPANCPPPPPPKPTLGKLTTSHKTFRVGSKQASVAKNHKPPVGTTFKVVLNTAATLTLTFTGPTHATLKLTGHAGTDRIRFDGRTCRHKRLKPGRYKLGLVASNSSGASRPHTVRFTIAKG